MTLLLVVLSRIGVWLLALLPARATGINTGVSRCDGWGQLNYTSYCVFEEQSVAVPADAGCYAGMGSRGSWSGSSGSSVSFQVVVNGGPVGAAGPGLSLRDAMVFAPTPISDDAVQATDIFDIQVQDINQPVQILTGQNFAAGVHIRISARAAPGLYRGQIAMTSSSGGICWALPYTLSVEKPVSGQGPSSRTTTEEHGTLPHIMAAARLQNVPLRRFTINVKDYGARGDGQTDDTAAIQLAMCAGAARTMGYTMGSLAISVPEVFIPAGVYILNSTLHPDCPRSLFSGQMGGAPVHLRGEGTPVLVQTNESADILFAPEVWRWRVHGLQFNNGRHHIRVGNNNTDLTTVSIHGCVFVNASAVAVRAMGMGELGQHYGGIGSAQFTISECQFIQNEQAVVNNCDTMTVQDCWVEGFGYNHSYDKAIFVNYDKLILLRMVGVPAGNRLANGKNRWIDNGPSLGKPEGLFVARDCRFGGEAGGMTVLVNRVSFLCVHMHSSAVPKYPTCNPPPGRGPLPAPYNGGQSGEVTYSMVSGTIIFDNCAIAAYNSEHKAAIFLEQLPSQLVVSSSNGFSYFPEAISTQMIRVSDAIDLDGPQLDVAASAANCSGGMACAIRFEVSSDNVITPSNYSDLPEQLLPFQSGTLHRPHAPRSGIWRTGAIIWAALGSDAAQNGTVGWRCEVGGKPGKWRELGAAALKVDDETF